MLIKALAGPTVSATPIIFGSALMDIVGGLGVLVGWTDLAPTTDIRASSYIYTDFRNIDWDHSLLSAIVLAVLYGLLMHYIRGYSSKAAFLGSLACIGHWTFDSWVILKKLPLYPNSTHHYGYGLYTRYPYGSWVLECAICLVCAGVAQNIYKKKGSDLSPVIYILGFQALSFSPWTSPLGLLARLNPPHILTIHGSLFIFGYIIPSIIWCKLFDAADRKALRNDK